MNSEQMRFRKISGVVANLHITQDKENFVQTRTDQAVGGAAAVGLAVGGLAGAATGAVLSSSDAADSVDFFTCTVDGQPVWGRFGIVSFKDGENVEAVGENTRQGFEAYAITRPSDRTVWMYPHCSRGTKAHVRFSIASILLLSIVGALCMQLVFWLASDKSLEGGVAIFLVVAFLTSVIGFALVGSFVATRFMKFAHQSNDIFAALEFENPAEVDLLKRLRAARKSFTSEDHLRYSPHVRWVYKY